MTSCTTRTVVQGFTIYAHQTKYYFIATQQIEAKTS